MIPPLSTNLQQDAMQDQSLLEGAAGSITQTDQVLTQAQQLAATGDATQVGSTPEAQAQIASLLGKLQELTANGQPVQEGVAEAS